MAIVNYGKPGRTAPWLLALLARKPKKLAAVAIANKNARIARAMMMRGEPYRRALPAGQPEFGRSAGGLQDNDEMGDR
jgi:transposase